MSEISLELKNIKKSFQEGQDVLESICLTAKKGEFVTLLGSSGCGKTTTLRIIAGLEQPDSGQVFLDGKDVTSLEPNQRNVNTVFQNYALFPHMNVADNIGYGLKLKKTSKAEISRRVKEMLELVQLPGFERRKPSELSRRSAPACGHSQSTCEQSGGTSSGRTPWCTGSAAEACHAARAEAPAEEAGDHLYLYHSRSGRSHQHV